MAINFDKALGIHERALFMRQQRNEVLAENIANADTPGYKARDIDFRAALSQSESANNGALSLTVTSEHHIALGAPASATDFSDQLKYRIPYQSSMDGNTVETHIEQAEFADNSMHYQTTLQFLGSRFAGMKNIIQGDR